MEFALMIYIVFGSIAMVMGMFVSFALWVDGLRQEAAFAARFALAMVIWPVSVIGALIYIAWPKKQ